MKMHVQFFHPSALEPTELIETCGDRGVIIYDGRMALRDVIADAKEEAKKRHYPAFVVRRGDSFMRCRDVSPLIHV